MTALHLRHAIRVHLARPGLTAVIVGSLALGIGVNVAIFSVVQGVLLRPLDYPHAERLVRLQQTLPELRSSPNPRLRAIWDRIPLSYLNVFDWRAQSTTLSGIGLYTGYEPIFRDGVEPRRLPAARVDAELLEVLAVRPTLGRGFRRDEITGRARVTLLSHGMWQEIFGGDPRALERAIELDGEPHDIVGVMPAGFRIAGRPDDRLWTPLHLVEDDLQSRDNTRLDAIGRRAAGASLAQTGRELQRLAASQAEAHPDTNAGLGARAVDLRESLVGERRPVLLLLLCAAGAVLLVACINVAHLLLARGSARQRELAVRRALGATRSRLVRQLLGETVLLALTGGAAGLALAVLGRDALQAWVTTELPRSDSIALDGRVLAFALGTSLIAALLSGLLPAWARSAPPLGATLAGASSTPRRSSLRTHEGLIVAEIALALILSAGAALLLNSVLRLSAVDSGFRGTQVLVQPVRLPLETDGTRRAAFSAGLVESLRRLDGVRHVALTTRLPLTGPAEVWGFRIPGRDDAREDWTRGRSATMQFVTDDYLAAIGIPLRQGRGFEPGDRPERGRVVLISETLARQHWPQQSAVGATLVMGADDRPYTVVGVVADVRHDGLDREPGALIYQPWSQGSASTWSVLLAVDDDPLRLAGDVRRVIRELDPSLPLDPAGTLAALLEQSLHAPRARTVLLGALAGLSLLLALIGTYAVTVFGILRRAREIGVRQALGASPADVRSLVLGRTLRPCLLGVALGLAGAVPASRLLRGLLFGIEPLDLPTLTASAALLLGVGLLAGYLAARRALRIDPATALRCE